MNIIFMGTPDFSIPALQSLDENPEIKIKGVVTQPDRKRGRGQKVHFSPVKKEALARDLRVFQSDDVNRKSFLHTLRELKPEGIVVVAFGQILGRELLALPEYGCINLHASLLPAYRGASPIHRAIIDGEEITGVTTMYMNKNLDEGDIIYQKEVEITQEDTAGTLHDKLADIGADLLVKTLIDVENGTAPRTPQNHSEAIYTGRLDKEIGEIDWSKSAREIYNLVRGVTPWPGAYTFLQGKRLKLWKTDVIASETPPVDNEPGTVIRVSGEEGIVVQTGKGLLSIKELQPAGKNRMYTEEYLHGYKLKSGTRLG
ncbi:MAG: methionyl-tRNA formyltransferase [Halanaerobiaceae bacterium]